MKQSILFLETYHSNAVLPISMILDSIVLLLLIILFVDMKGYALR